jgi:hypothetical protein
MKLEPLVAARRYAFVGNARELLQKAEEQFDSILRGREESRRLLGRDREERGRREEVERRERELKQHQMKEESAKRRRRILQYMTISVCCAVVSCGVAAGGVSVVGSLHWATIGPLLLCVAVCAIGGALATGFCICLLTQEDGVIGVVIVLGAILGGIGGIGLFLESAPNAEYWTWVGWSVVTWSGCTGAVVGLVVGLITSAQNTRD